MGNWCAGKAAPALASSSFIDKNDDSRSAFSGLATATVAPTGLEETEVWSLLDITGTPATDEPITTKAENKGLHSAYVPPDGTGNVVKGATVQIHVENSVPIVVRQRNTRAPLVIVGDESGFPSGTVHHDLPLPKLGDNNLKPIRIPSLAREDAGEFAVNSNVKLPDFIGWDRVIEPLSDRRAGLLGGNDAELAGAKLIQPDGRFERVDIKFGPDLHAFTTNAVMRPFSPWT